MSPFDHGARLWATKYCNTMACSSELAASFLSFPCFWGCFCYPPSMYHHKLLQLKKRKTKDIALCNKSCASTVDSTGIILLPFTAWRRTNQPQPYMPAATINSFSGLPRPRTNGQTDRQTNRHENRKVTIGPAGQAQCT